ncbi:hypothetical protein SAMN04244553_1944 [Nocardia amikacinitolerans]|uniref:Uncharacterized protein n=1 Tax=Nocardia amikacinitolerans TaxID=756689 RepID=A0A285L667_9NOCA|nr:hypothetical protein [Nocardia amikacinitolerans]SNY80382.1 hypothetical protein SAMN04244553_1944 [Nocardia amikacinitolerans]
MTDKPKSSGARVNPIVQAAADQVANSKRRRKDLHSPCTGQLSLFDPKEGNRS